MLPHRMEVKSPYIAPEVDIGGFVGAPVLEVAAGKSLLAYRE
jgi:hypothetical protein